MRPDHDKLIARFAFEVFIIAMDTFEILYVNAEVESNTGYALAELKGRPLALLTPHIGPEVQRARVATLHGQDARNEVVLTNSITRKDGSRYTIDLRVQRFEFEGRATYLALGQDATEKQLALEQLGKVLQGASLGFWDWDIELGTFAPDARWLEIHGYKPGQIDVSLELLQELTHPEDRASVHQALHSLVETDTHFMLDFRILHNLGREVWVRCCGASVVRDLHTGRPLRACGTVQEITQEKLAALEREEFLRFFNLASDLMMIGRLDGALLRANPATLRVTGYTEQELQEMPLSAWVHPGDRDMTRSELARQMQTGTTANFENRCVCKDGSVRWLSWHCTFDIGTGLSYATARDVSASKQLELALKHQQALFNSLVENTEDVICQFDRDLRHTYVNPSGSRVWSVPLDKFIGRTRRELGFPEHLCRLWDDTISQVFATGKPTTLVFDTEGSFSQVRIFWCAFPGSVENGQVQSVFTVARDITQYSKAEEELRKMHQLQSIGVLAGGIAHDFNNILTALFGNIELALREIPANHSAHDFLVKAENAFDRATHLTAQLLTFAKGGNPVTKDISLAALVREVVQFDLSGSKVRLVLEAPPGLWMARVDKGQIAQVFSNLATNANQAMPRGGRLYITLENHQLLADEVVGLAAGTYIRCTVRDEGVGIEPQVLDRIFDPYFTTKRQGSGLGLSIVFSIVARHLGHIGVSSVPGVGTTFVLHLPATLAPQEPEDVVSPTMVATPAINKQLLLMDDDEMICTLVAGYLGPKGYALTVATNGEQAVELYSEAFAAGRSFDCIIMDLTVPGGMSGSEALARILEIDPAAVAIVCSGYAADPVLANFRNYGFRGRLAKPYHMQSLQQEIELALQVRR